MIPALEREKVLHFWAAWGNRGRASSALYLAWLALPRARVPRPSVASPLPTSDHLLPWCQILATSLWKQPFVRVNPHSLFFIESALFRNRWIFNEMSNCNPLWISLVNLDCWSNLLKLLKFQQFQLFQIKSNGKVNLSVKMSLSVRWFLREMHHEKTCENSKSKLFSDKFLAPSISWWPLLKSTE